MDLKKRKKYKIQEKGAKTEGDESYKIYWVKYQNMALDQNW